MRLLLAELNRIRLRRMSWITLAVVVLALAGLTAIGINLMSPPSEAERAQARAIVAEQLTYWEQSREQELASCQQYQGLSEQECLAQYESYKPTEEMFLSPAVDFDAAAGLVLNLTTYLIALAALFVAASVIGADLSTGAMANWLTFLPRRVPVFLSRLVAVVLAVGVVAAVLQGAVLLTLRLLAARYDSPLGDVGAVLATGARSLLVVVALAVVGFTVACLARHTIAALGVVLAFGFVVIVKSILSGLESVQRMAPWFPEINLQAILSDGYTYVVTEQRPGQEGATTELTVGLGQALGYWGILLAALVVVSLLVFRRRDVA